MPRIFGKITERLLRQHGADSPAWNPGRDKTEPKGGKLPKGVSGKQVGGKPGRRKEFGR